MFLGLTNGLGAVNAALLALGRWLGAICVALMVVFILLQVGLRFFDNAPAWTEEATRFLMLWMTGLMAPTALRRGGFVSIEMLVRLLPERAAALLSLVLLGLSLTILIAGLQIGWSEVTGLGGRFSTDSLWLPALDFSGLVKMPKSWMMASLVVGLALMILVCVELMLRAMATLAGAGAGLHLIPETAVGGTE